MIGDSAHDLASGRAAGMPTVAVLTGPASRDDLAPHADVVLADIAPFPAGLDCRTTDSALLEGSVRPARAAVDYPAQCPSAQEHADLERTDR